MKYKQVKEACAKGKDDIIIYSYRNLFSWPIVSVLAETRATPNQVTLVSFLLAVISGFSYSLGTSNSFLIGVLFLQASFVLDLVDGDLSRAKKMSSEFGAWMDCVLDSVCYAVVHVGVVIGYSKMDEDFFVLGLTGAVGIILVGFLTSARAWTLKQSSEALNKNPQYALSKKFYFGFTSMVVTTVSLATLFSFVKPLYLLYSLVSPILILISILKVYKELK